MKLPLGSIGLLGLAFALHGCDSASDATQGAQPPPARTPQPSPDKTVPVPGVPVFACDAPVGALTIELPCRVGYPLGGSGESTINVIECGVHSASESGKMSVIVSLGEMSQKLGTPIDLSGFVPTPAVTIGDRTLNAMGGKATFSIVDVSGRAFLGRFVDATMTFTPGDVTCHLKDGLFWAVPGSFL
jgi:hypothetical protein